MDFGCYNIILDDGIAYNSDVNNSVNFKNMINSSTEEKFIKIFSNIDGHKRAYQWNYVDNPNFPLCSNLTNFEFRCMSYYLEKLEKTNPDEAKDFYKDFLMQKSDYHTQRVNTFSEYIPKLNSRYKQDFLSLGMEFEQAASNILKNADENIAAIEKAKMDIKAKLFLKLFTDNYDIKNDKIIKQTYNKLLDKIHYLEKNYKSKDILLYAKAQMKTYTNFYWEHLFKNVL